MTVRLYLESDLLGQFFRPTFLCTGAAIGAQGQEGRAHGGTTHLTDEVLGPVQKGSFTCYPPCQNKETHSVNDQQNPNNETNIIVLGQ